MTRIARILRDLCLIGCGVLLFIDTPPSLTQAGIIGALSFVWAAMIGVGAAVSLYGILTKRDPVEIMGCSFVGGGFLIWAIAAVARPEATLTSWAVALVFLAGTAGQFYRVGMIRERRVIR